MTPLPTFAPSPAPAAEPSGGSANADSAAAPNAAILPAGSESPSGPIAEPLKTSPLGRPGQCEPYREQILAKVDQQLTAQRIWQDLIAEHGFSGGYDSVKR